MPAGQQASSQPLALSNAAAAADGVGGGTAAAAACYDATPPAAAQGAGPLPLPLWRTTQPPPWQAPSGGKGPLPCAAPGAAPTSGMPLPNAPQPSHPQPGAAVVALDGALLAAGKGGASPAGPPALGNAAVTTVRRAVAAGDLFVPTPLQLRHWQLGTAR